MYEALNKSYVIDKKFDIPVKRFVPVTELRKIDQLYPFRRNSVFTILLLCLVVFNLAFLIRGILLIPGKLSTKAPCEFPQTWDENGQNSELIHVTFFAKYAYRNMKIIRGIDRTFGSILQHTASPLHLHILLDSPSKMRVGRALKKLNRRYDREINATFYDVEAMSKKFQKEIYIIKKYFFNKDVGRYNDDIFFMSQIFHLALPRFLKKIIFLDMDLKFLTDIKHLNDIFQKFEPTNVIGIGPDLQPQYRMDFAQYRIMHPNTSVGSARPGRQGFNTGVTLFDLERMRTSSLYNYLLNSTIVDYLCRKYHFRGYLGHQDFFTLTGMEYPDLYYDLDCSWNRQLDTGWKQVIGQQMFNPYHVCDSKVKIYHGNGNANIPND